VAGKEDRRKGTGYTRCQTQKSTPLNFHR
jgi:hypothetical protein